MENQQSRNNIPIKNRVLYLQSKVYSFVGLFCSQETMDLTLEAINHIAKTTVRIFTDLLSSFTEKLPLFI
jgi:hypothetical protein